MKKVSLFLSVVLLCLWWNMPVSAAESAPPQAVTQNAGVMPHWTEVSYVAHGVSITSSGKATTSSSVTAYSSSSKIYMTVYLQKLSGSSFENYRRFTTQGTGRAVVSNSQYVPKGTYRVRTTASIYDQAGNFIESIDLYSTASSY